MEASMMKSRAAIEARKHRILVPAGSSKMFGV
jgi:hypothetical protein